MTASFNSKETILWTGLQPRNPHVTFCAYDLAIAIERKGGTGG